MPTAATGRRAGLALLLGGLLALGGFGVAAQAPVTASVDRQQLNQYDLVTLTLRLTGDALGADPDFAPLQRSFDIRAQRQQQSSSISIINGQTVTRNFKDFILTLRPRGIGQVVIPALTVGTFSTQPIALQVRGDPGEAAAKPATAQPQQARPPLVFFETSVDTQDIYVQGQVIYTVRLFYTEGTGGEFPRAPTSLQAVVETLEREKRYRAEVQGHSYHVLEKRYALFPQKSGVLTIPPEQFTGVMGRGGIFAQRQQVRASSEGHRVRVKPKPPSFSGSAWLPAKSLSLAEAWSVQPPVFRVGEPVNRQLVVAALGISESLLPTLGGLETDNAKIYADRPSVSKQLRPDGLHAVQRTSVGIVPTSEGELRLPEIRIPWWNTTTDREAVAVIPAQTYQVLPGTGVVTALPLPAQQAAAEKPAAAGASAVWPAIAACFGLLWLLSTWQWLARRQEARRLLAAAEPEAAPAIEDPDESRLYRELLAACKRHQPAEAHRKLLLWARARQPSLGSLAELAPAPPELAAEIRTLETCLYTDAGGAWDGARLATLLAKARPHPQPAPASKQHLAPTLNPA